MAKFQAGQSGNPDGKFKPGQSGNPNGRPQSHLSKLLSDYLCAKDGKKTREQKLVEKIYELAFAGDMRAVALIWDRMEGKGCELFDSSGEIVPIHFVPYDPAKHGKPGDTLKG